MPKRLDTCVFSLPPEQLILLEWEMQPTFVNED